MDVVRGEEQKERFTLVLLDELDRLLNPLVGKVFIAEARGMPAGVEADAADAVVDRRVVAVRPVHLQRVAMRDSGGMIGARLLVPDPQRIGRIEIRNAVIVDIDLRHAVVGGRQQKASVETDFERPRLQVAIPIGPILATQSEVPLADDCGGVTGSLKKRRDGFGSRLDDGRRVGRRDAGAFSAKRIGSRQQRISRRRAGGSRAVAAGESQAFAGSRSMFGVLQRRCAVTGNIAVAEIVGHDDDDVGLFCHHLHSDQE